MSIAPTLVERSFYQIYRAALPASRTIPISVRLTKRAIDLVFALFGLLVCAILLPFLAAAIWLDSTGPIFYRQRRASTFSGRDSAGQCTFVEFDMLKLRTMRVDAEQRTGAVFAEENDPRVTRVGRVLRKTRLDELPQLWNVLKGDMSLVGPRPERPELLRNLAMAIPFFEERMRECKPGITGLAQVSLSYSGRPRPHSPIAALQDSLANPLGLEGAKGSLADDMRNKLLFDLAYVAALERFFTYLVAELLVIAKTPWVMVRGFGR